MNKRIIEFDYLRGVAIALIVLGHSVFLWLDGFPIWLENMLRGGTGLFVFISGFFFHRVFIPRFQYGSFLVRKAQLIVVPFLCISCLGLIFRIVGWWYDDHPWDIVLQNCWYTVRNGFVLYPHWYIPFIMLTFAMAPLHIAFARQQFGVQLAVLAVFAVIALFMHRPSSNGNFLQSLIYFTPFYLMGIIFSLYTSTLYLWRRWLLAIGLAVVFVTVYLRSYVFVHIGNYHKHAFDYAGIDLQFIQVLFGCVALLELCRFIKPGWLAHHLCFLAELSFPIFFIHPLFTIALENILKMPFASEWVKMQNIFVVLGSTALIFFIQCYGSVAVVVCVRRFFGQRSRWVIG